MRMPDNKVRQVRVFKAACFVGERGFYFFCPAKSSCIIKFLVRVGVGNAKTPEIFQSRTGEGSIFIIRKFSV